MHKLSLHVNFPQNKLINECAYEHLANNPQLLSQTVPFFLMICRRTYILNKTVSLKESTILRPDRVMKLNVKNLFSKSLLFCNFIRLYYIYIIILFQML